ncbi:MAG: IS110 family transposase [bacterium]|nr:IS110 family transposase [bacterium]
MDTITYAGVDLHKDSMTIAVTNSLSNDPYNEAKITKIHCKCVNKVSAFFADLPHPCTVAVEAVGFYHWFWDLVSPLASDIYLLNAVEVRRYAGRDPKTDSRDARLIARLLASNEITHNSKLSVFVPDNNLRPIRELARHRHQTARSLACSKNRFRRITLKENLPGPKTLDAHHALRWIRGFENKTSDIHKFQLRQLTDQIISFERDVSDIERQILDLTNKAGYQPLMKLLQTIPGIGDVVAYTIIAEIGDFSRFQTAGQIASFAGLTPRVFQSGDSCRHGSINKQGPPNLRWVLQQSAWVAIRHSEFIRKIFNKISRKAGKKKAACAIARKILVWSWAMAKNNTAFNKDFINKDKEKTERAA